MATLDKVNVFAPKDPKTGKTYQLFNTEAIQQKQEESKKNYELIRNQIAEGNIEQAYEGFTQLPFIEQMAVYMTPGLGNVVDAYEAQYFGKLATKENVEQGMRTQQEMELESLATGLPPTPFRGSPEQSLYSGLSGLAGVSSLIGVGELPSLLKGAVLFGGRKLGAIPSATDMGAPTIQAADATGGGGGIGGLPAPKQETTKDLAGTYSKTLEEAKAVSGEMSPQALLQYMKSNKRTNPSNNKTGTALTQSEIDEIDFSAFEEQYPNKNYTNEDILQYIDDNRIQLYRVSRDEVNPTYSTGPKDGIEFNLDEPLTNEIRLDLQNDFRDDYYNYILEQKDFFEKNFGPEGIINKDSYDAFKQRQRDFIQRRDIDTSGQAPSQLTKKYITETYEGENPFASANESQFDVFDANGNQIDPGVFADSDTLNMLTDSKFDELLEEGYTFRPKVMEPTFDLDRISERGAFYMVEGEYATGSGTQVYRYITDDDDLYEIIGSDSNGYYVKFNGELDDRFDKDLPLDEARIQISQQEGIGSGVGRVDDNQSEDDLIDVLPDDVIEGNATIPTQYGEGYDSFRLPMGGATNYQEHTIHVKNPKTATRYSYGSGTKHFGGGDELFHYRTTIRTDENGKKVLFVEEIQSDLHSTARSTKTDDNYELPAKERQKLEKQLEQEFGLTSNNREGNRGFGNFLYRGEPGTGGEKMMDIGALPFIAKDIKEGRTANFGSKNADDFVENFGLEKTQEIGDLVAKLQQGILPDFPYKGNAWVDAVTKDAMKLGAELDVDRVAFTNAAKQIDRNNKSLNYVQDRIITKLKTLEEIKASDEYAADLKQSIDTEYKNFLADAGYPEGRELPSGALTKEQWLRTEPDSPTYDTVLDELKAYTLNRQISLNDGAGQFKYNVQDVGYRLDDDEILNPQRIQMEGDDYDTQRINNTRLTNDEELLAEIPEKFKEQVKKDLAAGKKEITLNIDDLEGSGKKFLEIYKNGIIRGINKSVKDLKVDAKPDVSNVLFSTDTEYLPDEIFNLFKNDGAARSGVQQHSAIGIDLTTEMKQKLLTDGYASMYMGGKVTKSNSMDRPIEGNRREM